MYTHGDTYVVRSVSPGSPSRLPAQPGGGHQLDALAAALSERVNHLEAAVRRLDHMVAGLEVSLREAVAQGSAHRSAPHPVEFKTEPAGQTSWFPGATPRSGSALRAARAGAHPTSAIYSDSDLQP